MIPVCNMLGVLIITVVEGTSHSVHFVQFDEDSAGFVFIFVHGLDCATN